MKSPSVSIGIISDTHELLRQEALHALRGSELIIHAGDIGGQEILNALQALAPVIAVRGNTDHGRWADALPETVVAEAGPALIYVLHDVHSLDLDPAAAGFRMVVSGHSHKPERTERSGVIYLNPGARALDGSSCLSRWRGLKSGMQTGTLNSLTFQATRPSDERRDRCNGLERGLE